MVMLINILGGKYVVWDKSTRIEFLKPGKTTVTAKFHVSDERLAEIIERTKDGQPFLTEFHVDVKDADQEVVASVDKTLYIRKKDPGDKRQP